MNLLGLIRHIDTQTAVVGESGRLTGGRPPDDRAGSLQVSQRERAARAPAGAARSTRTQMAAVCVRRQEGDAWRCIPTRLIPFMPLFLTLQVSIGQISVREQVTEEMRLCFSSSSSRCSVFRHCMRRHTLPHTLLHTHTRTLAQRNC